MCDVIIIGNDLSSLSAAALASLHGEKTVLIAENGLPDFFCPSGYAFDIDPFPLVGLGEYQGEGSPLNELDPLFLDAINARLQNPGLQIIHRNHRIEFFSDLERLSREMEREFPSEGLAIRRFYTLLDNNRELIFSKKDDESATSRNILQNIRRFVKRNSAIFRMQAAWHSVLYAARKRPALLRVFASQSVIFSYLFGNVGDFLSLMHGLSCPLNGIYVPEGKNSLRNVLRNRFLAAGGVIKEDCSVMKVNVGDEIAINVIGGDASSVVKGRRLIVSSKWEKLRMLMLNTKPFRHLNKRFRRIGSSFHPFTLHMGICDKGLPEKMGACVILLGDKNGSLWADDPIILKTSLPGDRECAPEGRRALCATVFLKESPVRLTNQELKEAAVYIKKNVDDFLPFLNENLEFIDIDRSIAISRRYHEALNAGLEIKRILFSSRASSVHTSLPNVFITGGMLFPGRGIYGELLSGINAAYAAIKTNNGGKIDAGNL
jgi:phytoene dehydrogenase-like protein